jgi:hypothetical protein
VAARAQVSEKAGQVDQKHFGGKGAARKAELGAKVPPTAPRNTAVGGIGPRRVMEGRMHRNALAPSSL